jgi:hypothetical protein
VDAAAALVRLLGRKTSVTTSEQEAWGSTSRASDVLSPVDRFSEMIYGLVIALSVTGSISVGADGDLAHRALLSGALGANLAWGIVDAVAYALGNVLHRGRLRATERAVRKAPDAAGGRRILAAALPDEVVAALTSADLEAIRREIASRPDAAGGVPLERSDVLGAAAVFGQVVLSTFPVTLPFLLLDNARIALRTSNAVAVLLMFGAGCALGRYAGFSPIRAGVAMMLIGAALVGVIVALGG